VKSPRLHENPPGSADAEVIGGRPIIDASTPRADSTRRRSFRRAPLKSRAKSGAGDLYPRTYSRNGAVSPLPLRPGPPCVSAWQGKVAGVVDVTEIEIRGQLADHAAFASRPATCRMSPGHAQPTRPGGGPRVCGHTPDRFHQSWIISSQCSGSTCSAAHGGDRGVGTERRNRALSASRSARGNRGRPSSPTPQRTGLDN
jgi:hypothetical protein